MGALKENFSIVLLQNSKAGDILKSKLYHQGITGCANGFVRDSEQARPQACFTEKRKMKYDFTQDVTKDSVMSLDGRNKLEVMDQLITRAADLTKLNRDVIFRLTWKREQMMTTGVGGMLALPHIRVNDINHPYVIVGVCENPIEDYQSQDDQPVRVIVFTVAPDENQEAYLQLLGSISRKLRNSSLIQELVEAAGTPAQILEIVQREAAK